MEVTDESTSEDGTTTDTISFSNNDGKGTIKLYDVREDGSFGKCEISSDSGSALGYPATIVIATVTSEKKNRYELIKETNGFKPTWHYYRIRIGF